MIALWSGPINLLLLFFAITAVCLSICAWLSPDLLGRIAAHCLARKSQLIEGKKWRDHVLHEKKVEFGVDDKPIIQQRNSRSFPRFTSEIIADRLFK